jgi:glycosyltransferase involved in cell wall biosynthesis
MTAVSVVVPTFQRPDRIRRLIGALESQTLPRSEFEVVIADDGSRDETASVVAELASSSPLAIRVVRNEINRGPGAARNLGWRTCESPIIAFTDDDCVPTPGWLAAGLAAFDGGSNGIVQGRTMPDPTAPRNGWAKTLQVDRLSNFYESCNIFYRAEVLRAVGGFDEGITVPFGEDTAAGWKARRLGVTSVFAPDALVHHDVTYPPLSYWWRYAMMHGNLARLVRDFPEMRREMFWLRVFIWRDHAVFDAAAFGVAAGFVWRPAFLLVLPYVYLRRPRRLTSHDIRMALTYPVYDAAVLVGLLAGSIRERSIAL